MRRHRSVGGIISRTSGGAAGILRGTPMRETCCEVAVAAAAAARLAEHVRKYQIDRRLSSTPDY